MAFRAPPDLKALSLSLTILLSTYTTYLCGTPPNPTPYDSKSPDSMKNAVSPRAIFLRSFTNVFLGVCHAFLCLTYPAPPRLFCPRPSNLSPSLFTWTPQTIASIAIILLGSSIRLSAFSALGTDFTFRLAEPKKLVTTGLYKYMQHPSYTGKILIIVGNMALLQRPSSVVGCWLPAWVVEATLFWGVLALYFLYVARRVGGKRVKEEEAMMKSTFGKDWETWHAKTKRFIPGVF